MQKRYRLNLLIVGQTLLLLALSLGILFCFSHRALKQEALRDAEHTLEATAQSIDNILLSVEQSTGNIYFDLLAHVNDSSRMFKYCRELIESNPNIVGCAIAYKPDYFPDKELFMAYVHRRAFTTDIRSDLVTTQTFTDRPYTEQTWYTESMNKGYVGWSDPLKGDDTENEPLVNFSVPFSDPNGERIGVIAVDVSISQLSKIVLAAKPSERGYSLLLAKSGSLIVHPDMDMLKSESILTKMVEGADHTYHDAIEAMLSGQSGMKNFRMNGEMWTVFFKPFKRMEMRERFNGQLGWSVGVVYPDSDIHKVHYTLLYLVIAIAVVGMLVFFLLCKSFFHSVMKPLRRLTFTAQHIAEGNFEEMIPTTRRVDEVGHLQNRFHAMQAKLRELTDGYETENNQLHHQSNQLQAAYGRIEEHDRMKTSFLHYITNQMSAPAEEIDDSVTTLCNNYLGLSKEEIEKQVETIEHKSDTLLELLNHMAHFTESETGKEGSHE